MTTPSSQTLWRNLYDQATKRSRANKKQSRKFGIIDGEKKAIGYKYSRALEEQDEKIKSIAIDPEVLRAKIFGKRTA